MREISRELVIQTVKELCIEANRVLPQDMKDCLAHACQIEESPLGREVLGDIVRNYETAEQLWDGGRFCRTGRGRACLRIGGCNP